MIFMVSVCKTVTCCDAKIITKCVGVQMACFQSLNSLNTHIYMDKIWKKYKQATTYMNRAPKHPGKTRERGTLPFLEPRGGP